MLWFSSFIKNLVAIFSVEHLQYIQLVFYIREVRQSYISTGSMIFNNVKICKNKSLITKLFQPITIIHYSLYMTKTIIFVDQSDADVIIYVEKTSFLLTEDGYEDKWRVAPTNDVDLKANKMVLIK